jgi:DNA polymerase-3 subunit epsilon
MASELPLRLTPNRWGSEGNMLSSAIFQGPEFWAFAFALLFVALYVYRGRQRTDAHSRVDELQRSLGINQREMESLESSIRSAESAPRRLTGPYALAYDNFCAVDVETTGVKAASSRIIQLAIVLFADGRPVGKKEWMFNPGCKIPSGATKVNRITNEMISCKPSFASLADTIRPILEHYPLVAHNLEFDTDMLHAEFDKLGPSLKIRYGYCTMREEFGKPSMRDDPPPYSRGRRWAADSRPRWKKLGALAAELGVQPEGELHDAYVDAMLAGRCFIRMAERKGTEGDQLLPILKQRLALLNTVNEQLQTEIASLMASLK